MTEHHPITPSAKLVSEWVALLEGWSDEEVFTAVAQWGADQELDACCEWFCKEMGSPVTAFSLREERRPKQPSLKEQGLESLDAVIECLKFLVPGAPVDGHHIEKIRNALEALPDD
jgi:hypothetical protein